jgi:hypothetical protein
MSPNEELKKTKLDNFIAKIRICVDLKFIDVKRINLRFYTECLLKNEF